MTHAVANATNILRACSALGMETVLYSFCKDESKTKGLAQSHRAWQSRVTELVAGLPVGVFPLNGLVHLFRPNEGKLFHASPS